LLSWLVTNRWGFGGDLPRAGSGGSPIAEQI
jgi:hypothetical protein